MNKSPPDILLHILKQAFAYVIEVLEYQKFYKTGAAGRETAMTFSDCRNRVTGEKPPDKIPPGEKPPGEKLG